MDISGPDRQSLVYAFSPNLLDEFRFGFTVEKDGMRNQIKGRAYTALPASLIVRLMRLAARAELLLT
jgi:hypothetical protein